MLREGIAIEPLQWGGGQEAGLRAGTLPTALIVGFAAAARLALQEQEQRNSRLKHLRDQLWDGLQQWLRLQQRRAVPRAPGDRPLAG